MDAYRQAILKDLGVERYVLRALAEDESVGLQSTQPIALDQLQPSAPTVSLARQSMTATSQASPGKTSIAADSPRLATPEPSARSAASSVVAETSGVSGLVADARLEHLDLVALKAHAAACERCELAKSRAQTVFSGGSNTASVMLIGEAPGMEEEEQGEPFVGRAGQLLTRMLSAIGLSRDEVYIANLLKCRPTNNRDPHVGEMNACGGYLWRQIELVKPKLIVCVGRIAAHQILGVESPLNQIRGQSHVFRALNIPIVVTYHPNYLLKAPREKAKAWQDLKKIQGLLKQMSLN